MKQYSFRFFKKLTDFNLSLFLCKVSMHGYLESMSNYNSGRVKAPNPVLPRKAEVNVSNFKTYKKIRSTCKK